MQVSNCVRLLCASALLGLLGSVTLCSRITASPLPRAFNTTRIVVRVVDYVGLPKSELETMKSEGIFLLGSAQLGSSWLVCKVAKGQFVASPSCPQAINDQEYVLRITGGPPFDHSSTHMDALGAAYVDETGGKYATIYYGAIREFATLGSASRGQLLGVVAAHEIGHLLLGRGPHAQRGIMRDRLIRADLLGVSHRNLIFSKSDATRIRERLSVLAAQRSKVDAATGGAK